MITFSVFILNHHFFPITIDFGFVIIFCVKSAEIPGEKPDQKSKNTVQTFFGKGNINFLYETERMWEIRMGKDRRHPGFRKRRRERSRYGSKSGTADSAWNGNGNGGAGVKDHASDEGGRLRRHRAQRLYDQEDAAYREDSHEDGGDACGKRRKTGLEEADGTVRAFGGQCP